MTRLRWSTRGYFFLSSTLGAQFARAGSPLIEGYARAGLSGSPCWFFVGAIILYDATVWEKDIATILLDSRTREALSVGIGFRLLYYLLIGFGLLLFGFLTFLRRR